MTMNTINWTDPTWLSSAQTWIEAMVGQQGRIITGPITQPHVRLWSTVLRVPTDAGDWYFKAAAPVLRNEIPLTNALMHWVPGITLPILAVDIERGWMLAPDGGPRLRELLHSDHNVRRWEQVLPVYAETQMALSPYVSDIIAFGTPDHRLHLLPQHYEQLVAAVQTLEIESDERLTGAELHQLQHLAPRVRDMCAELAGYPIPASLNHGDLHDGNIFIRDGKPIFFDWGDASVTHPFVSLRTTFVSVEITFDLPEGGATDLPLRDAYLEPWKRLAPYTDLLDAFRLAQRIAPLVSALSWYRVMMPLEEAARREQGAAVHLLLREFLDAETHVLGK